jgi:hypothetical protein
MTGIERVKIKKLTFEDIRSLLTHVKKEEERGVIVDLAIDTSFPQFERH